jgi:EAL domain-containing protein (putative c-di-GMP-specific phosphodiesterase class I)
MVRKLGCRVSLDDFGSGHSAFQILRALEVDFVKIDGNFVTDALDTRHGKPFLRAIAQLCADIGIETIGERVENTGSIDLLREVSVSYGQGYFFAKPLPNVSDFAAKLAVPPKRAAG